MMVVTRGGSPTRIGYKLEGTAATRRIRIARKGGEILDKQVGGRAGCSETEDGGTER